MLQGKSKSKGYVRIKLSHTKPSNPSIRSKKTFFSSRTRSASSFVTPSLEACIRRGTWNQTSRARLRLFHERKFLLQSENTVCHVPVANHVSPSRATHPITVITILNQYTTTSSGFGHIPADGSIGYNEALKRSQLTAAKQTTRSAPRTVPTTLTKT